MLELWLLLTGAAVVCMIFGGAVVHFWEASRRERAQFDAEITAHEKRIEQRKHAPRHAATSPRTAGPLVADRPRTGAVAVARSASGAWYLTPASQRPAVTAVDLAPIVLPPARKPVACWPEADTGTLGKVTDTGEMRAATDEYIATLERQGAEWRQAEGLEGLTA